MIHSFFLFFNRVFLASELSCTKSERNRKNSMYLFALVLIITIVHGYIFQKREKKKTRGRDVCEVREKTVLTDDDHHHRKKRKEEVMTNNDD